MSVKIDNPTRRKVLLLTVCVWLVADLEALNFRFSTWFVNRQNLEF